VGTGKTFIANPDGPPSEVRRRAPTRTLTLNLSRRIERDAKYAGQANGYPQNTPNTRRIHDEPTHQSRRRGLIPKPSHVRTTPWDDLQNQQHGSVHGRICRKTLNKRVQGIFSMRRLIARQGMLAWPRFWSWRWGGVCVTGPHGISGFPITTRPNPRNGFANENRPSGTLRR